MQFKYLVSVALTAWSLFFSVSAMPTNATNGIVSLEEMKAWVNAQDPGSVKIIGDPFGPLAARDGAVTFATCSFRSGNSCSQCTVQRGNNQCIAAPGTVCVISTAQVSFCSGNGCSGNCNQIQSCGTRLDDGACFTPGTVSISVPFGGL